MALSYNIDYIHGASKVSGKFDYQINIYGDTYRDQQDTLRELLALFTKAHGASYDSDTVGMIGVRACTKVGNGWEGVEQFSWSYKIPKQTYNPTIFYVNKEALATFKFWYPGGKDLTRRY
jgi:hypothetical protein